MRPTRISRRAFIAFAVLTTFVIFSAASDVPGSAWTLLWRRSPAVVLQGVVHLAALAFLYLALGAAVLRRRDV